MRHEFCWADLSTDDAEAARGFYGALLGWEFEGPIASAGGAAAAAVIEQHMHASHWNVYVAVDSADDAAARAQELGATVVEPPFDVGPAGRLSLMKDPTGAAFCVWQAGDHAGFGELGGPGTFAWAHLWTPDVDRATRFYGELFGWAWKDGLSDVASALPDDTPRWSVYFRVAGLDATAARVEELGGRILAAPHAAAGGRGFTAADPTGAAVGFYEEENI